MLVPVGAGCNGNVDWIPRIKAGNHRTGTDESVLVVQDCCVFAIFTNNGSRVASFLEVARVATK